MNLKKTLMSVAGAAAIVASILAPVSAAPDEQDINASTNEIGTFQDAWLWDEVTFPAINVATNVGGTSTVAGMLEIKDFRADSPGWTVSLQSSILVGDEQTNAFINPGQVTVVRRTNASQNGHSGCSIAGQAGTVVNPSNGFYSLVFVPTASLPVALDANTVVMRADATPNNTRACGGSLGHPGFALTILPGQQVDSYTGTMTVTTVSGEPQGE